MWTGLVPASVSAQRVMKNQAPDDAQMIDEDDTHSHQNRESAARSGKAVSRQFVAIRTQNGRVLHNNSRGTSPSQLASHVLTPYDCLVTLHRLDDPKCCPECERHSRLRPPEGCPPLHLSPCSPVTPTECEPQLLMASTDSPLLVPADFCMSRVFSATGSRSRCKRHRRECEWHHNHPF